MNLQTYNPCKEIIIMAYSPIVNVAISINATPLTQAGFGTPLFITSHRFVEDRVLEVTSTNELTSAPYNFPTDHPAVIAAGQAFAQTPRVPVVKIGRRDAKAVITLTPPIQDQTTSYVLELTVAGLSRQFSADITDVGGNKTVEDGVDALILALYAEADISALNFVKVGNGVSATLEISSSATGDNSVWFTNDFAQSSFLESIDYVGNETPADTLDAIQTIDTDWYFVAFDDRSNDATVIAMADALAATGLPHIYFVGSEDVANVSPYQAGNVDLFSKLRDGNYDNVVTFFHHLANENFVEMAYIGANAPYEAGSVTWANVQIANVGFSQDPSRNRPLTTVQKSALNNKNANYVELDAGIGFTRSGKTAGGEWIDVIRGADWQAADMGTSLRALLLNQKGGKISYTDQGTAQVREVITSSLQRGVNREFLESYTVFVPLVADIAVNDRLSRILTGVTFTGYLAGAINEVTIQGEVTI